MRSATDGHIAVGIGLVTILCLAWLLYRPRVQRSTQYQSTVVPLANIMDVGFILFSPAIVLLVGYRAPFFMLGICLVAIAAGLVIAYNIRHYEPIEGEGGLPDRIASVAQWSLLSSCSSPWPSSRSRRTARTAAPWWG
jgi:hypothetical protein